MTLQYVTMSRVGKKVYFFPASGTDFRRCLSATRQCRTSPSWMRGEVTGAAFSWSNPCAALCQQPTAQCSGSLVHAPHRTERGIHPGLSLRGAKRRGNPYYPSIPVVAAGEAACPSRSQKPNQIMRFDLVHTRTPRANNFCFYIHIPINRKEA